MVSTCGIRPERPLSTITLVSHPQGENPETRIPRSTPGDFPHPVYGPWERSSGTRVQVIFLCITSDSHTYDICICLFECLFLFQTMSVCLGNLFDLRRLLQDPNYQSLHDKFKVDVMMVIEFNIYKSNYDGIPVEAFFSRRALLVTVNCVAIHRMLGVSEKR